MALIEKQKIAEDPTTPAEVLTKLYYENPEEYTIVNRIVSNKNTPPELISFIVNKFVSHGNLNKKDIEANMIQFCAAQNPSSPPELLIDLCEKWSYFVKKNPNTPSHIKLYLHAKNYLYHHDESLPQ